MLSPQFYSKPMSPVSRDQEIKMYQRTSDAKGKQLIIRIYKVKSPPVNQQKRIKQRCSRGSYLNLSMSNQNKDSHKLMQYGNYKFA